MIGKEVTYQQVPIERYAEIFTRRDPLNLHRRSYTVIAAHQNGSTKSFRTQHLHEVATDHKNGLFAGTNNYIAEIGGHPPMTV